MMEPHTISEEWLVATMIRTVLWTEGTWRTASLLKRGDFQKQKELLQTVLQKCRSEFLWWGLQDGIEKASKVTLTICWRLLEEVIATLIPHRHNTGRQTVSHADGT